MKFRVAFLRQNLRFLGVAKIRIKIWKYFELGGVKIARNFGILAENGQKFWNFSEKVPKFSAF